MITIRHATLMADRPTGGANDVMWDENHVIEGLAAVATTGAYGDLTGIPATFTPTAHTHVIANITGLQAALDAKQGALVSGTSIKTVNGQSLLGSGNVVIEGGTGGSSAWGAITGTLSDQLDLQAALNAKASTSSLALVATSGAFGDLIGIPVAFPPMAHGHVIADVAGLQAALDGKQPLSAVLTATTASFTTADKAKLDGVTAGATANATDAQLRDRATHTGEQAISTVTGLQPVLTRVEQSTQIALSGRTATIMGFGDSFAGSVEQANGYLSSAIRWARHYWEPGLDLQMLTGFAVGGSTTLDLPNQFANYTAGGIVPDIAVVNTLQNESGPLITDYTNRMTIYKTFVQNLLNSGVKLVIICSAMPVRMINEVANTDLLNFTRITPGTAYCDTYSQFLNPAAAQGTTGIGSWRTVNGVSYTVDGTHPSQEACKQWGRVLADILRPMLRRIVPRIGSNEIYSSGDALRRYANAILPHNMNGNFGQLNGVDNTGVAGTAANADNRWRITTTNGVVVTPSIITTADGLRRQRMVLSGTVGAGSQGNVTLDYSPGFIPLNGSQPYYGQAVIDFNNVVGLTVMGTTSLSVGMDANGGSSQPAIDTLSGRYFTWRNYTSPADGNPGVRGVSFSFQAGVTVSGTIDVGQCGLYRISTYVPA